MNLNEFAKEWIEAWNAHDLDRILSHYTEDFEITTPMIKIALGIDSGSLKGKDNIREYWSAAFKKIPDLHFDLKDATEGLGSIAIYYQSVLEKMAMEVMFFNENDKFIR